MTARSALLSLAVFAVATTAQAQGALQGWPSEENYHVRLEYREYRPQLEGFLRKDGLSTGFDAEVEFADDLGMPDDNTPDTRLMLQFRPGKKIRASYVKIDNRGDQRELPRTFTYGSSRYVRATAVSSSLKGRYYAADLEWDLFHSEKGFLGVLLGGRMMDTDIALSSLSVGLQNRDTYRSPLPTVGAVARFYVGRISLEGEVAGMSLGDRGKVLDASGFVRVHISDRLALGAGYRAIDHTGEDGEVNINFKNQGAQFGLELSF